MAYPKRYRPATRRRKKTLGIPKQGIVGTAFLLIWINYEEAILLTLGLQDAFKFLTIRSGIRSKTGHGFTVAKTSAIPKELLERYFTAVAQRAAKASQFAIMGPDRAKLDLRDYVSRHNHPLLKQLAFFDTAQKVPRQMLLMLAKEMKSRLAFRRKL